MKAAGSHSCPMTEQAVGWALHALEPDEEMEVVRHLPKCPTCRETVHAAQEVLPGLGSAVEQVEPPSRLRDNLLAAAAETPQYPPVLRPRPSLDDVPSDVDTGGTVPSHQHLEVTSGPPAPQTSARPGRLGRLSSPRGRMLVAASLALVAVLGIGGLSVRTAELQAERDAQSVQAQSIFDMVARFDEPGSRHAFLAEQPGVSPVAAVLVNGGESKVLTVGLPANATDRDTYVLWGMRDGGTPQAVGTFDVVPTQGGAHTVGSVPQASGFTAYAISIEPGRTPPAAPSQVIASGRVGT